MCEVDVIANSLVLYLQCCSTLNKIVFFFFFPDPDVGPSIFVCDVELTSFNFGLCGRKFVMCLFGQCPGRCTICHSRQHTGVLYTCLIRQMARLLLNISRRLAYAALSAMILRCISLSWLFSLRL